MIKNTYIPKVKYIIRRVYDGNVVCLVEDNYRFSGSYGDCIILDDPYDTFEEALKDLTEHVNKSQEDYYTYTIIPQIIFEKEN